MCFNMLFDVWMTAYKLLFWWYLLFIILLTKYGIEEIKLIRIGYFEIEIFFFVIKLILSFLILENTGEKTNKKVIILGYNKICYLLLLDS